MTDVEVICVAKFDLVAVVDELTAAGEQILVNRKPGCPGFIEPIEINVSSELRTRKCMPKADLGRQARQSKGLNT